MEYPIPLSWEASFIHAKRYIIYFVGCLKFELCNLPEDLLRCTS